ncbi:MAG: GGDEF domain-containing protein [Lachnospirales bacterium]
MLLLFYGAIIVLFITVLLIMIASTYTNEILPLKNKFGFIRSYISLICVILFEYFGLYAESKGASYRTAYIGANILLFTFAPTIPIFLAASIYELKHKKVIIFILFANFLFQVISIKTGWVFIVDEMNIYHRGEFYWVYFLITTLATFLLFYYLYLLSKQYQTKNNILILFILTLHQIGSFLQMANPNFYTIWPASILTVIMVYIHYISLINQVDSLTSLLNRRCYENKLVSIKNDAIVLYFDIDKFKVVNDTYGHSFGDIALHEVGFLIKKVYSSNGYCYRIGGDEFSVILHNDIKNVDKFNANFIKEITELNTKDSRFPFVSVGYGYYYPKKNTIDDAIEQADKMMYAEKHKNL